MQDLWNKIGFFTEKEIGVGASELEIQQLEAEVQVRIRGGYREFLKKFGWAQFAHHNVLGIARSLEARRMVAVVTRWEREDSEPPLPKQLLPIMADGAGNHYCVDFAGDKESEPPVVFWDHEQGATTVEGASFAAWLTKLLDDLRNRPKIEIDMS